MSWRIMPIHPLLVTIWTPYYPFQFDYSYQVNSPMRWSMRWRSLSRSGRKMSETNPMLFVGSDDNCFFENREIGQAFFRSGYLRDQVSCQDKSSAVSTQLLNTWFYWINRWFPSQICASKGIDFQVLFIWLARNQYLAGISWWKEKGKKVNFNPSWVSYERSEF